MANMQGAPGTDEEQKSALEKYGVDLTETSPSELMDSIQYHCPSSEHLAQISAWYGGGSASSWG